MKYWKKRVSYMLTAGLLVGAVLGLGGCGTEGNKTASEQIKIVTTVFPVYDVVKQVGGDKVDVKLLVPPGAEPHDWEPTAGDLKTIGSAKVFVYSGAGLEPTEKILAKDVIGKTQVVELSKGLDLLQVEDDDDHDGDHKDTPDTHKADEKDHKETGHNHKDGKEHEEHHHDGIDPHVWLDPMNVVKEVDTVVSALSEADPTHKEYYKNNGDAYKAKLMALDKEYSNFAQSLPMKDLVVSHEAFAYLAKRYGFTQLGIMGVAPDAEPTPERMAQIVDFIKEHQVKAIFSEELVSPKLANAIAQEGGVKVYVLNPAEGLTEEQSKKGVTYLQIMEENLKTLKLAFGK